MTDYNELAATLEEWSETAGDHHMQAAAAVRRVAVLEGRVADLYDAIRRFENNERVRFDEVLARTPRQSLARVRAEALRGVGGSGKCCCSCAMGLRAEADRIEQEGNE